MSRCRKNTIIVTGGAGFIGYNLIKNFKNKLVNTEIVCLDNMSQRGSAARAEELSRMEGVVVADVDVCDLNALKLFAKKHLESTSVVFHLASRSSFDQADELPSLDLMVNGVGTANMCEIVRKTSPAPLFVLASSSAVYNDVGVFTRYGPSVRDSSKQLEVDPRTAHGLSKYVAERYVAQLLQGYVIMRTSLVYGDQDDGLLGRMIEAVIEGKDSRHDAVCIDRSVVTDLLDVQDWCSLAFHIFEKSAYMTEALAWGSLSDEKDKFQKKIDVGGGQENVASFGEVFDFIRREVAEATGGDDVLTPGVKCRLGSMRENSWYVSDLRQVCNEFSFNPRTHWRDGLKKVVAERLRDRAKKA